MIRDELCVFIMCVSNNLSFNDVTLRVHTLCIYCVNSLTFLPYLIRTLPQLLYQVFSRMFDKMRLFRDLVRSSYGVNNLTKMGLKIICSRKKGARAAIFEDVHLVPFHNDCPFRAGE